MENPTCRSLFLSHGAPTAVLGAAADCWHGLGTRLGRPRAVVMVSAHWMEDRITVGFSERPHTLHDFSGFPTALYRLDYPAPGAPGIAEQVRSLLTQAELAPERDPERGLDHGAWIPLMRLFPSADVPIVPVSLQVQGGPKLHVALGRALAPLQQENVLIITSGGLTHNLQALAPEATAPPEWVTEFQTWMHTAMIEERRDDLLEYRRKAPHAAMSHPSEEHLLPLFVALGAAGSGRPERVCSGYSYGTLAMDAYLFS
ncbi:MAG: DODA-type extradiol aromatic ring-opening family dioxygenase [Acidiferrobacteraceae bacterium]